MILVYVSVFWGIFNDLMIIASSYPMRTPGIMMAKPMKSLKIALFSDPVLTKSNRLAF